MNLQQAKDFAANHRTSLLVILVIVLVAGAFVGGRYSAPEKTVTVTKTVEVEKQVVQTQIQYVEKKVYVKADNVDVHQETDTIKAPDGTVTTKVIIDDRSKITESSQSSSSMASSQEVVTEVDKTVDEKKTVIEGRPDWHLALRLGAGLQKPMVPLVGFGLSVERRILGPVWTGLWADLNGGIQLAAGVKPSFTPQNFIVGVSVGFEF